ncbi:MAG: CARDB domain-containing protein, partial [Candidatus Bathyarchaeia archaeon]
MERVTSLALIATLLLAIIATPFPQAVGDPIPIPPSRDVKFRGPVIEIFYPDYAVRLGEVLEDPTGSLRVGIHVWVNVWHDYLIIGSIEVGDIVEVYGELSYEDTYDEPRITIYVKGALHYIKEVSAQHLPDLAFASLSVSPPNPRNGDPVYFSAVILNHGDGDAYGFRVDVYLDGQLYDSGMVSLGAHASETLWSDKPWTATEGTHTVKWVADTTNIVAESNEGNNEIDKAFTVESKPPPSEFDFTISVEPLSQTVKPGETLHYTVTVSTLSGSSQTVSLSLSGQHETVSYAFNPSSGNPPFTSTLTVTTSASTPAGTYTLTITGRDGRKSRSASVRLSVEEVFSPEQLLKLAEERRDTYDMLYKVLDPKEVSIQIQEEYARVYRDMWEDLYDVAKSGDSPEAIVGIFELVLNAISKLDRMGKLLYLQNILIRPEFTQLETYIGQMRDLTDREIIAIRNRDFNSLKNIYDQEQRTLIDIKNHLSIRVKPSLDNLIRSWVEYQAPITKSENIGKLDVGETNS